MTDDLTPQRVPGTRGTPRPTTRAASSAVVPEPRIGQWLSDAFEAFGQRPGLYIAQTAFVAGPGYLVVVADLSTNIAAEFQRSLEVSLVISLFSLLTTLWTFLFTPGMFLTAHRQLRGEPVEFGTLFQAFDRVLSYVGVSMLAALMLVVGFALCILPGFALLPVVSHIAALVVVGRRGPIDALGDSWKATTPHYFPYLGWVLLLIVLQFAGVAACYVGTLVSTPIIYIAQVVAYRYVFERQAIDADVERVFGD